MSQKEFQEARKAVYVQSLYMYEDITHVNSPARPSTKYEMVSDDEDRPFGSDLEVE